MLIINADDWGKSKTTTNNCLHCIKNLRVTSTSAMVFMQDSARASELALEYNIDVGLHVNFTLPFNGECSNKRIKEYQKCISAFLLKNKYQGLIYNPLLKNKFVYIFKSQLDEFLRLYNKPPAHINGHQHMHLCTNMLFDKIIPFGYKVRRSFSFFYNEKNIFNRYYRYLVYKWLQKFYLCTDYFFAVCSNSEIEKFIQILKIAKTSNVELMVHPENEADLRFLLSDDYHKLIKEIPKGGFANLQKELN